MDTLNGSTGITTLPKPKPLAYRNLQPRAAAALDFNDDSDDEDFGLLSADYKAQRKTTLDLVDFFKNAPPPPPAPALPPITVDDKKKRTLLQRLRNRRSNSGLNGVGNRASFLGLSSGGGGLSSGFSSGAGTGVGSTVSAAGTAATSATLPNGKKYVMIAVDYKDTTSATTTSPTSPGSSMSQISPVTGITGALNTVSSGIRSSPNSSRRHSRYDDVTAATGSSLLGNNVHVTTTFDSNVPNGYSITANAAANMTSTASTSTTTSGDQRRSITIQAGGGEGSTFILDNTPFLLDNFALDTDFIMPSNLGAQDSKIGTDGGLYQHQQQQHRRTQSQRSGHSQTLDGGSRRGANKVTFNIAGQQHSIVSAAEEDAVSKALALRIANHKAQLLKNHGLLSSATDDESANESGQETKPPEVTLPRPISRKKVRHVQIQTQHCILRPMYTQTEPVENLVRDSEVKEFSTQTMEGTCEMGTSTELDAVETASVATSTATTTVSISVPGPLARGGSSKVASLVASLSQPPTPTSGIPPSMFPKGSTAPTAMLTNSTDTLVPTSSSLTPQEQEELVLLRQKNAALQAQVQTLQRDLASEMRARTRTAVAMQDTRDKFEMLSAIAYKKIKEMIFQRHVLEMEVRELRAQVDMHNAEDAAVSAAGTVVSGSGSGSGSVGSGRSSRSGHRQHHHQQQQQHQHQNHQYQQQQHQQHHHLQQHQQHHQQHQQQYVSVGHY
ncbi:hypothetical protein EC991_001092 [Linnemannia zychae]|nr:hypothetical protein EC991_001092 [Linnemannia zychae]